jgi:hypothetical protein
VLIALLIAGWLVVVLVTLALCAGSSRVVRRQASKTAAAPRARNGA